MMDKIWEASSSEKTTSSGIVWSNFCYSTSNALWIFLQRIDRLAPHRKSA